MSHHLNKLPIFHLQNLYKLFCPLHFANEYLIFPFCFTCTGKVKGKMKWVQEGIPE